jgi:hypothetical protein
MSHACFFHSCEAVITIALTRLMMCALKEA